MTELNKFEVIRLLHFYKRIQPCHVAERMWLSKTYACLEGYIFCIREKDLYIDTSDDNESVLLFLHQNSVLLHPSL